MTDDGSKTGRGDLSRRSFVAGAIIAASAGPAATQAAYPTRPVTIIVPTGAGAALDTVARGLASRLEAQFRMGFVVENKPGANATIGSEFVARSTPDGHTLLYTGQAITVNPSLYKTSYDAERSFAPIATVATAPITMVVPANSPFKTVPELIAVAKSKPGALTYGSAGHGSPPHLTALLFEQKAGVSLTHVPYKGAAQALTDVLGDRLDVMFPSLNVAQGFVAAGKLRALGIASEARSPLAPEIATVSENGLPGFVTSSWAGLVAPAGTPPDVVARLESAVARVLEQDETKDFFGKQGVDPNFRGREAFAVLIRDEIKSWAQMLASVKEK